MPSSLYRAAIERTKRLSGIPYRAGLAKLEDLSTVKFWEYQKTAFLARYHDAVTHVPYYDAHPNTYPKVLAANGSVIDILSQLPILPKDVVRSRTEEFWRRPPYFGTAQHTTGGSTGSPLRVRASLRERGLTNAILEQRYVRLVGERAPRVLRLSGYLDDPKKIWMRIPGAAVAYVSIYALNSANRELIANRIRDFRPQVLHGYASALSQLALLLEGDDVIDLLDLAVISTSESLFPEQRELIKRALGARVVNEYGSQEGQHLASECPHGALHIQPSRGVVELLELDSDAPTARGELGRVVVTGIQLGSMPLFRYDLGDTAVSNGYSANCACGLAWPTIGTVYGRTEDLIRAPDGRRIGLLSHSTMKDLEGVRESQIVQRGYADFVYRIVLSDESVREHLEVSLRRQLTNRLGYPVSVSFDYVNALPRSASGKLQAVVVEMDESAIAKDGRGV